MIAVDPTGHKKPVFPRLLDWKQNGQDRELRLLPYPKSGHTQGPPPAIGLPARPKPGLEPRTDEERVALAALQRMTTMMARVQEVEPSLDDPAHFWSRLAAAWRRAEDESDPRMAEIVRQAKTVQTRLRRLEGHLRRVLRRHRELIQLDRVQEMDRASMLWLARQPGGSVAERAGAEQRILSTTRREHFDTLENRVLHSYAILAANVAREWLREHDRARAHERYKLVDRYRRYCRRLARSLAEQGITRAEPGITPNYVLTEDPDYREVRRAWERLLRIERTTDDLWAWQAESWTDFCTLAVILGLERHTEARLLAQYPIVWKPEANRGRWFDHANPLAVFVIESSQRIVEIHSRPKALPTPQARLGAFLWLWIMDIKTSSAGLWLPIWTPHTFTRLNLEQDATEASRALLQTRTSTDHPAIGNALLLTQAHGDPETIVIEKGTIRLHAVALDASGNGLVEGLDAIFDFLTANVVTGQES
ncbi:MAG: hypothetical protein VBE63_20220 [Lamprobacter sp.]|uniref:hypothetical protein n=1 Tax=Lamprobacter sp. TaxID=3100796 RepID=UPI002B25C68C|nr:hypothetical protein [Lamprobacter sp.]MEA3642244.1 hypothetical protein [Lamprobacter sp.]